MASTAQSAAAGVKCSKCSGVLDSEGYPKWCKACRSKYNKEYAATKEEMQETRGFSAGVSAMRHAMAEHFKLFGNARFSGVELWQMISKAPGPEVRQ